MKNPLRDEAAAFKLVWLSLGYFGLIALASWISTWLGIAVFVVLSIAALIGAARRPAAPRLPAGRALRRGRHPPAPGRGQRDRRGRELLDLVGGAPGRARSVLVLSPALNSRVRTWTSDEDGAREAAQVRLDASIEQLAAVGVQALGEIGDGDPVQAVEDALRSFPADEIVLSTHPPGRSHWLERGVVLAVRERFDLPVTHVVVDLERQTAT